MNWLMYLLEANTYIIIFFAFYKFLLHKETFHTMNRHFLILSSGLAFLLPMVKLGSLNPVQQRQADVSHPASPVEETMFTLENGLILLYILVVLVGFARLALKLAQIYHLIHSAKVDKVGDIYLVQSGKALPFSFFNYLFMNPSAEKQDVILSHEKVHIQQRHSADILYFELLAIINWFNPCVYLMRRDIKAIHEYLADEQASRQELAPDEYASFLIRHSCSTGNEYLANQMFNQSLLKKRIIMLSKKKSSPTSRLKYGLMIMLIPLLVCASSMAITKSYGIDLASGSALLQDTSKKQAVQPVKSSAENKDLREPKVQEVKFTEKSKQAQKPGAKKKYPEPKVQVVKFSAKSERPQKSAAKKKYPEPKIEVVKFSAKDQQHKKPAKKKYPEPTVERVKTPPTKEGTSATNVEGKKPAAVKKLPPPVVERVKTPPPPKVERVITPPPPKVAMPASPPVVEPEDEQVPPPPPPAEPLD